jgi:hypothetical protein
MFACVSVSCGKNLPNPGAELWSMASIAAAQGYDTNGSKLSPCRHAIAKMPQQQQPPSLLPRLRHNGGCSRVSRRCSARKIRIAAPSSRISAAHFGDKVANMRHSRH